MAVFEHLLKALAAVIAAYSLYLVGNAIYNITLHPLAKFPGKKIDGAFRFPWHWHQMTGNSSAYIKSLHDQYGDVVRISPYRLSFNTSPAWPDIKGHKKGRKGLIRDPTVFHPPKGAAPDIIMGSDADHTRMRRLIGHSFSDGALREQEPLIHKYCDFLVSRLHEQIEGPSKGQVDIMRWLNFTTFDIIGDLVFSEPFQALEKGVYHKWMDTIFQSLKAAPVFATAAAYPLSDMLFFALMNYVPALAQAKRDHANYTKDKVTRRLESHLDHKDFMSHILRHNDEKGMSKDEIVSNSAILILAGSETTATLLSGLTFLLLKNPNTMFKLTKEIRESFKSREDMTFVNEAKLSYLRACLDEALRIYPPVPGSSPLWVPPEGITVNGRFIPGNTSVGVHALAAYRSAKNFRDPDAFVPERWLGDERYAGDDRDVVLPFGAGSHSCLGMRLAYAEMQSIMVRLLWNFDMELCTDSENFLDQKVFVLWDKPALNVKLSARIWGEDPSV